MIRPADVTDLPALIELAEAALGWPRDDPNEAYVRWKHFENPAGHSPMWLAERDGEPVGFRTFLRWRFRTGDGETVEAVRAVDPATSPAHLRHGIFRQLTLHGVEQVKAMNIGFVFNTPNAKSQEGYLKMGWQTVGRVPLGVRPRRPTALLRMIRGGPPASKWSDPTTFGQAAPDVLGDSALVPLLEELRAAADASGRLTTDRNVAHLTWRYGFGPLCYRAVVAPGGPQNGVAVFRTRKRGEAAESVLCELLVRPGDTATARHLVDEVSRANDSDYLIAVGRPTRSLLPAPGRGPVLTWRTITKTSAPPMADWDLSMGDVELL